MTFPVLEATARGVEPNGVTTHDVVLPPVVNAGDVMVARFVNRESAGVTWDDATAGEWLPLHSTSSGGFRFSAFWKIADGSEGGAILAVTTSAATRSAWHVDRFSGAQAVEAATPVTGSAIKNPDPPNLDPSWDTEDVYWLTSVMVGGGELTATAPANYSGLITDSSGGGTGSIQISSAYRQLNAASQNPGAWAFLSFVTYATTTYAVRSGATLFPPRLDVGVTFFAPSVEQIVAPPRLDVGIQFFPPRVASLQDLLPPRLDVGVTIFAPFVGDGLLSPRLDIGVTIFPPTVDLPGTLQPPRLDIGIRFFPPLVEGGFRVVPQFTSLSFGPFPGAIADAELHSNTFSNALSFESRFAMRGPLGYTDFAPFVASMYEFEAAYVWLRLTLDQPAFPAISITQALVHIDVPDQRDSGEADIPVDGAFVSFVRFFNVAPDVVAQVITAVGVTEAPKVTVRQDITTEQFFAVCHTGDDTDNSVAARIKWVAQGY